MRVITVARKPFSGSTLDAVREHGTAALNIDAARVPVQNGEDTSRKVGKSAYQRQRVPGVVLHGREGGKKLEQERSGGHAEGRYPTNLVLQGEAAIKDLDDQSGYLKTGKVASHSDKGMWKSGADIDYADKDPGGGASRFFKRFE